MEQLIEWIGNQAGGLFVGFLIALLFYFLAGRDLKKEAGLLRFNTAQIMRFLTEPREDLTVRVEVTPDNRILLHRTIHVSGVDAKGEVGPVTVDTDDKSS